jgi:membrane dipeptidase
MTLTHNCNNPWAQSCCDPDEGTSRERWNVTGLTKTTGGNLNGVNVVREMNRIGMMVDLSHTSPNTMRDALTYSQAPVIFSHSGVLALTNHPRNVPDDVIDSLHCNGGLLMITFITQFTEDPVNEFAYNNVSHIFHHIDYVRNRTGSVENIGIGSDFEGEDAFGEGYFPR